MITIPFLEDFWFRVVRDPLDDTVDRLGYLGTAQILLFFAIMVSAKQYVGLAIKCWVPRQFGSGWQEYVDDHCFVSNTYFVPPNDGLLEDAGEGKREIGYYQWVPIVLALQGLMFWIPCLLWKGLRKASDLDPDTVINTAVDMKFLAPDERQKKSTDLIEMINNRLKDCYRSGRRVRFLSYSYLIYKMLTLIHILSQLVFLNKFLGSNYTLWGLQTLHDLMSGRGWNETGAFPRVTFCDLKVRSLAHVHQHTVQCLLMVNMFNEKIYLMIWFWLVFALTATFVNSVYSCVTILSPRFRQRTIERLIKGYLEGSTATLTVKEQVAAFTERAMTNDIVLLFIFIERNAGPLIAEEMASTMWNDYEVDEHNRERVLYLEEIEAKKKEL